MQPRVRRLATRHSGVQSARLLCNLTRDIPEMADRNPLCISPIHVVQYQHQPRHNPHTSITSLLTIAIGHGQETGDVRAE